MKRSTTAAATAIAAIVLTLCALSAAQPATQPGRNAPFLGVKLADMNEEIAAELGIEPTDGVFIGEVIAGGPAEAGGVKDQDIIKKVNGAAIKNLRDLQKTLGASKPGDVLSMEVLRGKETQELKVTLGTRPATMPS